MKDNKPYINPYFQIIICALSIGLIFIISIYLEIIQNVINFILYNSAYITLVFGGVYFIFNIFYYYNHDFNSQNNSYEKLVMDIFVKCILNPLALSIGFYTTLVVLKLNVIDYAYISEKYTLYDRSFMIGAMILLLIYIMGKALIIVKKQIDFWRLHILKYKEAKKGEKDEC